jgi:hypothetical protein
MTFDTFANLQTEILAKLNRAGDSDAVARCPSWITLAEDEMRMALTRLTVRQGETTDIAYSITSEYNTLPTGFLRGRNIVITSSNPTQPLTYATPKQADEWDTGLTSGLPTRWTIQNNQLRVNRPPDTTYTASFTYYALVGLSVSNTSNWLLSAHPKLYFKAALAEAYDYYENAEGREAAYADRDRMLSAIYTSDGSDQQLVGGRMRPAGTTP